MSVGGTQNIFLPLWVGGVKDQNFFMFHYCHVACVERCWLVNEIFDSITGTAFTVSLSALKGE